MIIVVVIELIRKTTSIVVIMVVVVIWLSRDEPLQPSASSQLCRQPLTYLKMTGIKTRKEQQRDIIITWEIKNLNVKYIIKGYNGQHKKHDKRWTRKGGHRAKNKKNNITWVFYYCTFFCATEKKTYTTDYGVFLPGLVEMCVSFVGL